MTRRYVYELPFSIRKSLCRILDATDEWEELGGEHMGFDYTYLQYIRRKDSPTDELLTAWGNQNHTVNDLFILLSKMQNYRSMALLKDLVQEQYHHLLRDGEETLMFVGSNKNLLEPANINRPSHRQNITNHSSVVQQNHQAAARLPIADLPNTFEDNKDLGLDQHNLNLVAQKFKNEVSVKTINEIKIQNVPNGGGAQQVDENFNAQNNISIDQPQAAYNPNVGPGSPDQLEISATQKPGQERKLSNVSVTSSVMEGCTPMIEYEELEAATKGWDPSFILGRGGFGTVYKGTWKNTLVAIKKLDSQKDQQMQTSEMNGGASIQSLRELRYLNSHRHDNILSLYGFCISENVSCLVYQYMANGSLEDRLHCRQNTRPLNWVQRLNIMTGTARGIQFLHSLGKKPLVHGDIKSGNILLDGNFEPRLGDFGLAREGPLQQYTHVKVSRVHGTRPYLPDEFLRGKQFSVKVDTYSFGVVLFEVATGLRAYDDNRKEKFLKDHIVQYPTGGLCALADPLAGPDYCASAAGLLTLGRNCVTTRPKDRPDMKIVLNDVTMLYNNYKSAERATTLARQRSLTPTNPLEMQVVHDEQRNHSPHLTIQGSPQPGSVPFSYPDPLSQKVLIISSPPHLQAVPPPQGFQLPRQQQLLLPPQVLSPEAQHYAQGLGNMQVLPGTQTGMPKAIIIHHPPPTMAIQPPTGSHTGISPQPQVDTVYRAPPSPVDSSQLPQLTLLGMKSEPDVSRLKSSSPHPPVQVTSTEDSNDSIQSLSSTQEITTDVVVNNSYPDASGHHSDFAVSLPGEQHSAYIPLIPDLLGITTAKK